MDTITTKGHTEQALMERLPTDVANISGGYVLKHIQTAQVEAALGRLVAAGLVEIDGITAVVTDTGRARLMAMQDRGRSADPQVELGTDGHDYSATDGEGDRIDLRDLDANQLCAYFDEAERVNDADCVAAIRRIMAARGIDRW